MRHHHHHPTARDERGEVQVSSCTPLHDVWASPLSLLRRLGVASFAKPQSSRSTRLRPRPAQRYSNFITVILPAVTAVSQVPFFLFISMSFPSLPLRSTDTIPVSARLLQQTRTCTTGSGENFDSENDSTERGNARGALIRIHGHWVERTPIDLRWLGREQNDEASSRY